MFMALEVSLALISDSCTRITTHVCGSRGETGPYFVLPITACYAYRFRQDDTIREYVTYASPTATAGLTALCATLAQSRVAGRREGRLM